MQWEKDKFANNQRAPMLKDKVELLELPDGEDFKLVRMIGPSKRVAYHMLPVFKQDGTPVINKFKQQTRIPKMCLAYDSVKGEFAEDNTKVCPYCKIDPDTPRIEVHSNVIDRELAEDFSSKKKNKLRSKKEKKRRECFDGTKWYFADNKASKTKTPVRFWRITSSVGTKISDYTSLNKKKSKDGKVKVYGPNHPKFGFDLNVKFDNAKKNPSEKYSCVKDERNELTEEELQYLLWDIDIEKPEEFKVAKKEAESFKKRMDAADGEDGSKKRKSSKDEDEDDDDDFGDDEDFEDDDEDEDEKSSKKKGKKSKSSKKRSRDDDDDDDELEDDDDEDEDDFDEDDEDERPSKKKGKKAKSSKKSRKHVEEEDDDDDEEDEDDDDDSWDSDEDGDDDDDDDDEPKKKVKSKKSKKKEKKSSKKRSRDDDDEDEDEEDDDDEDWDDD